MPPSFNDCFGRPRSRRRKREKALRRQKREVYKAKKDKSIRSKRYKRRENYGKREKTKEKESEGAKRAQPALRASGKRFLMWTEFAAVSPKRSLQTASHGSQVRTEFRCHDQGSSQTSDSMCIQCAQILDSQVIFLEPARRQNLPRLLSARNQSLLPDSRK